MTERELYFISGSPPCWTVMLALEVKRIAYQPKRLDNAKREQKSPGFLAINPRGQVPVLCDENGTVCETLAILSYLDAVAPTPSLFGDSPTSTAEIWQVICECDGNLSEPVGEISRPLFRGKAQEFATEIKEAATVVKEELALLESRLGSNPWLIGDQLSAADLVVFPVLMQLARAANREDAEPLDLAVAPFDKYYPQLGAWCIRFESLPGYKDAYPPHWV